MVGISRLGRDSNNFVHLIELAESVCQPTTSSPTVLKPGTSSLLAGTTKVVIRISNPQAMLNEDVRVQNEVAAMCLMRQALSTYQDRLIPNTYAWCPSIEGYGWILQEYMAGAQLDKEFHGLDRDHKQDILHQIADVFKLIQSYSLPESVKGYGGLAFNECGEIVTGPTTIPCGGPFSEFHEMYMQMLRRQLIESDTSERIAGWRRSDLRDRLERFVTNGIAKQVVENSIARQTLVHGDFSKSMSESCNGKSTQADHPLDTFNMLFNPTSNRLTALLDFDLSHIATPADEYFYSFRTVDALLAGPFEEGDEGQLRRCLLDGFDENIPAQNGRKVNFEIAQIMDKEFVRAGVLRPADIQGAGELAGLKWFLEDVSPPYFFMSRWLEHMEPEKVDEIKTSIEENLSKYLERWGF